jgi:hypothetical protein
VEPFELLSVIARVCESSGIRYVTVGSLATIAYGEPRFTNDIDVVLDLQAEQVGNFCQAFPAPDYYVSRPAVEAAVRDRRQFNIIHTPTALKVDCFIPASDFDRQELARGVLKRVGTNSAAMFATPEDVILKKMEYYRLGGSDKHLRDIAGVLRVSGELVDRAYITALADQLQLTDIWQAIVDRLQNPQ